MLPTGRALNCSSTSFFQLGEPELKHKNSISKHARPTKFRFEHFLVGQCVKRKVLKLEFNVFALQEFAELYAIRFCGGNNAQSSLW